jgi:hypothetical protein
MDMLNDTAEKGSVAPFVASQSSPWTSNIIQRCNIQVFLRPMESETLEGGTTNLCFRKLSGDADTPSML